MKRITLCSCALVSLLAATAIAENWPEYMRDSQRNAQTSETLKTPLNLQWVYTAAQKPSPAWPPSARYDYYHGHGLRSLVTYDHVFQVIVADGKLYYGSSADDGLHCLDAKTGRELWAFYAEGPIRLAPAYADGKVIFSCDDGQVYAVSAKTGKRVWVSRPTPTDLRIGGNERIISMWPNRTGVVIDGKTVFVVLGFFPTQKMYVAGINIADGKVAAVKPGNQSFRGYVRHWRNRLLAPRGRQVKWSIAGLANSEKPPNSLKAARAVTQQGPFMQIATKNLQIGGGNGKVAAFRITVETVKDKNGQPVKDKNGKVRTRQKADKVWEAKVQGQARSLAVSDGRLFVSTSDGKIYCFAAAKGTAANTSAPKKETALDKGAVTAAASVKKLLAQNGIYKGYGLVLGTGGDLAAALAQETGLKIIYAVPDADKAQSLRRRFAAAGLAGRLSIHHVPAGKKLPYADWLFDMVTHDGIATGKALAGQADQARRVLRPYGGIALLGAQAKVTLKTGPLKGAGQWTHFYANPENNTCSGETRVGDKLRLQWFGRPGPLKMVDRHNRGVAPLCKDGRLFVSGYDRLFCINAFNGAMLWEHPVPKSARIHGPKVAGSMAVADDAVYIASGPDCIAFDVAGGEKKRTFSAGQNCEWGYVATVGDVLIGSRCGRGAHIRRLTRSSWQPGYGPGQANVSSFDVFAFDRKGGKRLWTYEPKTGVIINTTLVVAGGNLYFIESKNPGTKKVGNSRMHLGHLLGKGSDLVAVDLKTGKEALHKVIDLRAAQHQLWMAHSKGVLLISGTRITGKSIFNDIWAFSAKGGSKLWTKPHPAPGRDTRGNHGELTYRPAIIGDRVLAPPVQYELKTGKPIAGWQWKRGGGGCGAISTSATHVFNRGSNPHMMSLKTKVGGRITRTTRPGCWINIIPACGMVLIPEGSSGCHCPYQIQTSLGFVPAK